MVIGARDSGSRVRELFAYVRADYVESQSSALSVSDDSEVRMAMQTDVTTLQASQPKLEVKY
jgi:hypothetical protein